MLDITKKGVNIIPVTLRGLIALSQAKLKRQFVRAGHP